MGTNAQRSALLHAAKTTLPVLFGYVPLGMAFGLLISDAGYGAGIASMMSLFMYAGSNQFLAVQMFKSHAGLIEMFLMALFLSARHMVYGLSLIGRYAGTGAFKPYLIFSLTDEVYGLMVGARPPEGANERLWQFFVAALCQSYWVVGTLLGSVLGAMIAIDTTGLDFALTALFVVLTMDLMRSYRSIPPFAVGALCGALALIIPDRSYMMPAAMVGVLAMLIAFRTRLERRMNADAEGIQ